MKKVPRISYSPRTNRWFVVTDYRVVNGVDIIDGHKHKYIVAKTKHDVTDQMAAILKKTVADERARHQHKKSRKGS